MNQREALKTMVRGAYDVQKLRIQMGNRIVANFKARLGQKPSTSEEELDDDAKLVLATLRATYKKITDGRKRFPTRDQFQGDEVISTYTELCLMAQYDSLANDETAHFNRLGTVLRDFPIYTEFLEPIKGIGPAMAGVIVSEFDITKARYPSSLWKYSGLDVAEDGAGRSRRKEHLVESQYTDADGEVQTKMGISFNPFLKTKLIGVLAGSFIKCGNEQYAGIYRDYKHRLECHAKYGTQNDGQRIDEKSARTVTSKARRHAIALRYMVKMFLIDLYKAWRAIEGLPVALPYHEAKLGLRHSA